MASELDRPTSDPRRPRPALRSLLTPRLRWLLGAVLLAAGFMVANTLYLLANRLADGLDLRFFAAAETSLPKLFQLMVLTHTGVGLLLAVIMVLFFVLHLPKVWRRRHDSSVISGIALVTAGLALAVTGLFILTAAATRDHRWVWWIHVSAAALIPAGYVAHRVVSYVRPPKRSYGRFAAAVGIATVLLMFAHGFTKRDIRYTEEAEAALALGLDSGPGGGARDVSRYIQGRFVPSAFVPPASPFFPSAATTTTGGLLPTRLLTRGELGTTRDSVAAEVARYGFVKDAPIGAETCRRCHQDIVQQWEVSAHRFASFNNPFYEATINDLRANANEPNVWIEQHVAAVPTVEGVGIAKSKWCSGCHDPALMMSGGMDTQIDRASVEAQAGLTCMACHAIDGLHGRTGNSNYNIADEQEDPYLFSSAPPGTFGAFLHDASVRAKPTVHQRLLLKPFFRDAEYCSTCHKVSLAVPVNNYRWLRGQNEFDNWDDSGVSLNAARTFYLPPVRRVCQDCHMPPEPAPLGDVAADNGMVRSHRFLAVNTALPYVRGDTATIRMIEEFLRDEKLRVDVFALTSGRTARTVMALDRGGVALAAGDLVTVDVVVRNQGVGHTFPGGTNDSNEGWLEFTVLDDAGTVLAQSGFLRPDGHLDPMAHVFKALILDREGNPIHRRNAQDIFVTVFANVIGPGTADIAHYEFVVPPELAEREVTFRARLLWRKFDRDYTEFAFNANPDGFRQFDAVPDLPVTEIAVGEVTLPVGGSEAEVSEDPAQWVRFNDFGIGLLLEGNTRLARQAFEAVARLAPDRVDGPLNLARAALSDGNLADAFRHLDDVEAIEPGNARAAWVWGGVLQEDGRYAQAVAAYERVLQQFPGDRATWRNLGRTFYLDAQYERALEAFDRVLEIDSEDRVSHYHRMLILRALGRESEAEVAAAAYAYHQIDESAQEMTRRYRQEHPGANLMAQPVRTHKLTLRRPPPPPSGPPR